MASHGYSGVKRFFVGSFAEQMLRFASCPVLVFRGGRAPGAGAGAGVGAVTRAGASGRKGSQGFILERLLVAHDFSVCSRPAMLLARDWAKVFGATMRLHFVVEHYASLYDYAAHMEGSFKEYLEKVRQEALARFRHLLRDEWKDIPAEAVATTGDPVEEILREAKEFKADLIVVGTHTRSGLERFFLGSVAQKTVRKAPCSVLVVRATDPGK
jgi:nucleotide-binding universal stress UspA family protein